MNRLKILYNRIKDIQNVSYHKTWKVIFMEGLIYDRIPRDSIVILGKINNLCTNDIIRILYDYTGENIPEFQMYIDFERGCFIIR